MIQTPKQQVHVRKLLSYQFRIEYKPGTSNKVADALSRLPDNWSKPEPTMQYINSESSTSLLARISSPLFDAVPQLRLKNTNDPYLIHLHEHSQQGKLSYAYSIDSVILYFNSRFITPQIIL